MTVCALLLFLLAVFALVGMSSFSGALQYECIGEPGLMSTVVPECSVEQQAALRSQVTSMVAGVLGTESVDSEAPLMDAGLDSLGAVELRNSMSQLAGMELPGTLVFDYPSVTALAGYLSQQVADAGGVVSDDASTVESVSSL